MNERLLITPRSLTQGGDLSAVPELAPLLDRGYELVSGPAGCVPTEAELTELLEEGVVGWLAGIEKVPASVLEAAGSLRAIARNGTGADAIDLDAAKARGIAVLTAPGANAQGVAELALTLGLAALRDVVRSDRSIRTGGWHRTRGRELADIRVGVVGYGAIGRKVADLFSAVGAQVTFFDLFVTGATAHHRAETLSEMAAVSDLITLHVPPKADGTPLIDARFLEDVVPGTVLVNTARSGLVASDAVADALDAGVLSAYAVDAFDSEPPARDRLILHERTILTAHIGGFTDASVRRATDAAVINLLTALSSEGQ
jgi:phosphoglycerate dehydrogenase-like enzyme